MFTVPVINLSPYVDPSGTEAKRAEVARALDVAATSVGFMQIVGHGASESAIKNLQGAFDEFYALPLDVKKRFVPGDGRNRGYSPPKSESLSMSLGVANASQMNDFFEAFTVAQVSRTIPNALASRLRAIPKISGRTMPRRIFARQCATGLRKPERYRVISCAPSVKLSAWPATTSTR